MREPIQAALGDARIAHALFYLAVAAAEGTRARAATDAGRSVVMDRFLASTIAYARARGVDADFDALLPALPRPDVSVLLTLDEDERIRRLGARGEMSLADIQSLDPTFRGVVMAELGGRCDLQVDVTGGRRGRGGKAGDRGDWLLASGPVGADLSATGGNGGSIANEFAPNRNPYSIGFPNGKTARPCKGWK
ncbi:hypothetical protein ACFS3C_00815 [Azotobacter vinelandii]